MRRKCLSPLHFIARISFLTVLLSPYASLAATPQQWVARAVSVQGTVESRKVDETQWQPVKLQDTFLPGDTIRVQEQKPSRR